MEPTTSESHGHSPPHKRKKLLLNPHDFTASKSRVEIAGEQTNSIHIHKKRQIDQLETVETVIIPSSTPNDEHKQNVAKQNTRRLPMLADKSSQIFASIASIISTPMPIDESKIDQPTQPITKEETSQYVSSYNEQQAQSSWQGESFPSARASLEKAKWQAEASKMTRTKAVLLISLLCVIVIQTFNIGPTQFLGSQGWAYDLTNLSTSRKSSLPLFKAEKPGTAQSKQISQQYINDIVNSMTLDQKLGQMMMIQFVGPDYSLSINTMITQYNVGAVLLFDANGNIVSKSQLTQLTQQIQQSAPLIASNNITLPLAIATDQEGGAVDRLQTLDGPSPAEATIGATNDPAQAKASGEATAQALSSYGLNLNLAPVVDVDNTSTSELHIDGRTYGSTPDKVTEMAAAYLQGLQESGKVFGTLKHFPGLGSVTTDPHVGIPYLNRSENTLEQIDWAPYQSLIQQHLVHAIMVTHEIVPALDPTRPSSLSPQIVQGILRDKLGFQGVILTDSLTMTGITAYVSSPAEAAAMAVEAGSDMIMGASSPSDLDTMIGGIKQAINSGAITQSRINDSVQRILQMKYQMGLLPLPTQK